MSGRIRLLVSDIDGTLVRPDKSLGPPVEDACRRLRAAGVHLALVSARPVSGMLELVRRTGADALCGAFNGGALFHPDGRVVSAHRLAPNVARRALDLLREGGAQPWLFADGRWYALDGHGPHTASERITAAQEPVVVDRFDGDLLARVDKLVGVSDDAPALAALERRAAETLGAAAAVARSQSYYLDVTAPEADKGRAVRAVAEAAGVDLREVAVIGDGRNDTKMFAVAGRSFAVANAADEVRTAATETVASNADDGVAQAIGRLLA